MNSSQNFIDHLEALRSMVIKCLIAIAITYIPAYLLTPYCIQGLIVWSFPHEMQQLNFFAPLEVFITQLKLAFVLSLIISFPYCIWQIWQFLLPALYQKEKEALQWWIVASCFLFLVGALFCIAFLLPLIVSFSLSFSSQMLNPVLRLADFLGLAGWLTLAFGLMFQLPLVVLVCVRFGLITADSLRDRRPYIAVIILIVAAILTPPDIVSQLALGVPTYLLFELGLLFAGKVEKEVRQERQKDNTDNDTMLSFYDEERKK